MTDANPSDSGGRQDTCIDLEEKVEALSRELSEARERETATSEVLRVIASSPNDVQPVFDTVVTSAARLCKAQFCWVFRFDGKLIHFAAEQGLSPEYTEAIRRRYPIPPGRASAAARAVLTGTVAEIPDVQADPPTARLTVVSSNQTEGLFRHAQSLRQECHVSPMSSRRRWSSSSL
jgi:hypothetical protein